MLMLRFLALTAVAALVGCAGMRNPAETALCAVLANPAQYYGERVRVRGVVQTDYFEFSGLRDESCPPTFISFGPERSVETGLHELEAALERVRQEPHSVVDVVVDGTIEQRPGQIPNVVLVAHRLSNIHIREARGD